MAAIFDGHGGTNGNSPPQRGKNPRGQSALDVIVEGGFLPTGSGPVEFAAWLREPVDLALLELEAFVTAEVTSQNAATVAAATVQANAAAVSAAAAAASQAAATASATGANTSATNAAASAAAAAASAAAFVAATVQEVWAGTAGTKYIPPSVQKASVAFVAADAAEIVANTWTPDCLRGFNRGPFLLNANKTLGVPINPLDGVTYVFAFKEDATGGRTLTIPTGAGGFDFGTGENTITTGANKYNRIIATYSADAGKFIATLHKAA